MAGVSICKLCESESGCTDMDEPHCTEGLRF